MGLMDSMAEREAQSGTKNRKQAIVVPLSQRRGLFARFSFIPEIEDPQNYSRTTKWSITLVVAIAAIAAPIGSSIIISSLPEIVADLRSSAKIVNLSVALYMLSLAIFPIFWSSFSESLGRRTIYIASFFFFTLFNILSAISTSISMLVVFRILAGGASGSVQAVGAGTIADVWHVHERGRAMSIFYLGPMMGPLLAPIIGGALQLKWGWRSTMWFLVIYGIIAFLVLVFFLPETLVRPKRPLVGRTLADSRRENSNHLSHFIPGQSVQQNSRKLLKILKATFIEPFRIIRFLRFPAVAFTIYYASITFGSLYVIQLSIQSTFSKPPYAFSSLEVGLCYIGSSLGYVVCSAFGGRWTDAVMARAARHAGRVDEKGNLLYHPEDRMKENVMIAAIVYPLALLWYGWTSEKHVFWFVPLLATFFFGLGSMMIFTTVTTMLTEFMPKKTASGVALNNLCRNIFSAVGGVVTEPLLNSIGAGWTFTALCIICAASSLVIWAIKHYGPRWRISMDEKLEGENL